MTVKGIEQTHGRLSDGEGQEVWFHLQADNNALHCKIRRDPSSRIPRRFEVTPERALGLESEDLGLCEWALGTACRERRTSCLISEPHFPHL